MNQGMTWFRAYADMVDDEKLRLLAFEDRWHFVALLCCKRSGLLDNGDALDLLHRKLAVKMGLQLRELEAVGKRLAEVGLIDENTFQPLAWDERQFLSDSSTDRVRAYRDRKRRLATPQSNGETLHATDRNVSVTAQETDTETEHISTAHAREAEPVARDGDGGPEPPSSPPGALATRAMIEAGMPATRLNPSHPELLEALGAGVTPAELADVAREMVSRGTGPPAMVYVIRTAVGRRRTAASQRESEDAAASTHRPCSPGRQSTGRARSAVGRQLDAIKRRRAREAGAAGLDAAGPTPCGGDG